VGQLTNADLRAESLRSTEFTALWRPSSHFDASTTWYRLDLSDSINFVDLPGGQQVYANTGGSQARGLELEATWQSSSGWRLRGSWARQSTRDLATGAVLSDSPRSVAKLMATMPALVGPHRAEPCASASASRWQVRGWTPTCGSTRNSTSRRPANAGPRPSACTT
jgi:outer membrane receptor protein involved in Fe transport